ncbi:helix-turn-helix transcriptional regulator [Kurthia sp. Dielmo]|uniref:helix-turn-helix domain-containing protein n=1 Tax=Kurthia sp. Dielmo TaxID=1033738 RepID=UPI0002E86B1F|nr:helix-turn-helix transcriptional regulator [Kurthia sp. Dielmo]
MKKDKVSSAMKEMRGGLHQQKFADELNVSRESISKYENGRSKVPADISRELTKKYNQPQFAVTIAQQYTGTGPIWLDGPNVDLHRSSVKEKTLEELEEAIHKLRSTSLAKPLVNLTPYELQSVRDALEELVEAQTAMAHLVAVVCMETGISYTDVWAQHYRSLQSSGYVEV